MGSEFTIQKLLETKTAVLFPVPAGETVQSAASVMAGQDINLLVVTGDHGKFKGVLFERDLVGAIALGEGSDGKKVEDIYTSEVLTCGPGDDPHDVITAMNETGHRHMPVVEDGTLHGIVSLNDLTQHILREVDAAYTGVPTMDRDEEDEAGAVEWEARDWGPGRAEELLANGMTGTFQQLTTDDWKALIGKAEYRIFGTNDVILEQGAVSEALYIIANGKVWIEPTDGTLSWRLARLGSGAVFGEMSLLDHSPAAANVVASGQVEILYVTGDEVAALAKSDPEFASRFYQCLAISLSGRLRATNDLVRKIRR